jgi:hypothetical protein
VPTTTSAKLAFPNPSIKLAKSTKTKPTISHKSLTILSVKRSIICTLSKRHSTLSTESIQKMTQSGSGSPKRTSRHAAPVLSRRSGKNPSRWPGRSYPSTNNGPKQTRWPDVIVRRPVLLIVNHAVLFIVHHTVLCLLIPKY